MVMCRENGLAEIEVLDVPSRRSSNADAEDGVSGGIIEGNLTSSFLDSSGDYDNLVLTVVECFFC